MDAFTNAVVGEGITPMRAYAFELTGQTAIEGLTSNQRVFATWRCSMFGAGLYNVEIKERVPIDRYVPD